MASLIASAKSLLMSYATRAGQHIGRAKRVEDGGNSSAAQVNEIKTKLEQGLYAGTIQQIITDCNTFLIPGAQSVIENAAVADRFQAVAKLGKVRDDAMAVRGAMTFAAEKLKDAAEALRAVESASKTLKSSATAAEGALKRSASDL